MIRKLAWLWLGLAALAFPGALRAADDSMLTSNDAKIRSYAESMFKQYDKNKDGVLDKDEYAQLGAYDKNHDGKLTIEELIDGLKNYNGAGNSAVAARPSRDDERVILFEKLDVNHDGQINPDEVPEEHRRLFDRLLRRADRNNDGKLSREEFLAGLAEDNQPRPVADRPPERRGDGGVSPGDRMAAAGPQQSAEGRPGAGNPQQPGPRGAFGGGSGGGGSGGPPGALLGIAVFRALDTNNDGKLDAKEIGAAGDVLKKLAGSSGELTREDLLKSLPPGMTAGGGGFGGGGGALGGLLGGGPGGAAGAPAIMQVFRLMDKNGDGKLQKDELPSGLQDRFDEFDKNHDGVLDETEIRELRPQLISRLIGRGQDGQGPPPDRAMRRPGPNEKAPENK